MAKTQTNFFDADFAKFPDFTQLQADYSRMVGEFGKIFANGKMPSFDIEAAMTAQRKNVEAFTLANRTALEGVQAMAKRQAEIVREAVDSFAKVAKDVSGATVEEKLAKQAEMAKEIFENAIANVAELKDMALKSQEDVASVVAKRIADNLDEVKAAFAPKAVPAAAKK